MAARPQRHANHPRVGTPPVYEDFKPDTKWNHQVESDNLLIQLPGFAKEHLKVSMVGTAELRIRGERLVGGEHRWSHFEEAVTIPEDCNRSGIRAKFEHGVLTITMPKMHKDSLVVPQPTNEQALPSPETRKSLADQTSPDQKKKVNQQEVQSKKHKNDDFTKQENGRKSLADHFSSEQETTKPPPAETPPGNAAKKQPVTTSTQETSEEGSSDHKSKLEFITTPENDVKSRVKDETRATEPEKGNMPGGSGGGVSNTPAGIMNGFKFDKYMQAVKDVFTKRTELNEERQLMVNVGTAIIVIVGLAACISYITGLSG